MKPAHVIGVVGENPKNDSAAIIALLKKMHAGTAFKVLLKNMEGSQILSEKALKMLRIEAKDPTLDFILFVYDADDEDGIPYKTGVFHKHRQSDRDLLLLNIYEMEALILTDLGPFNKKFNTQAKYSGDPMRCAKPKEWLQAQKTSRKYHESDMLELLPAADPERLQQRCAYFAEFATALGENLRKK